MPAHPHRSSATRLVGPALAVAMVLALRPEGALADGRAVAPDGLPPELSALSVSTTRIDLGGPDRSVVVSARVSDPAGVRAPTAVFGRTSQEGREYARRMTLVAGTTTDGTWTARFSLPADLAPGYAVVHLAPLVDEGGMAESRPHYLDDSRVEVVAAPGPGPDTSPPRSAGAGLDPAIVNLAGGPKPLTATVALTDPSGVAPPQLSLVSSYGGRTIALGTARLVSGTTTDGRWSATAVVEPTTPDDRWSLKVGPLRDLRGNVAPEARVVLDDAVRITHTAPRLPREPDIGLLQPRDGAVEISWRDPAFEPVPITSWVVTDNGTGRSEVFSAAAARADYPVERDRNEVTVDGLANGRETTFTVAAVNQVGQGLGAVTRPVVPDPVPDAPTDVRLSDPGDGSATLSWRAPLGGPPVDAYRVDVRQVGGAGLERGGDLEPDPALASGGLQSVALTGLDNGAPYQATVRAVNGSGPSVLVAAPAVVTPRGVPGVASFEVVPGDGHLGVVWWPADANNDGGSPVQSYTVRVEDQSGAGASVPEPVDVRVGDGGRDITGLTDGASYRVVVTATNHQGTGPEQALEGQVPTAGGEPPWADPMVPPHPRGTPAPAPDPGPLPPTAPTGLKVTRGSTTATATWRPPVDDAGSPVTAYVVRALPAGPTVTVPVTGSPSTTLRGLVNGSAYRVEVRATSAGGSGDATTSGVVVPAGPPGAPRSPTLVAGRSSSRAVRLGWTAGSANGSAVVQFQTSCSYGGARLVGATSRSVVYSRLRRGAAVSCVVRARNAVGWSAWSARTRSVRAR